MAASTKPLEWRRLLFGLCLFHAVVQDRRKFGPLGWNIRYDFTDGDLSVSLAQLQEYLDSYDTPPFRWGTPAPGWSMVSMCASHHFGEVSVVLLVTIATDQLVTATAISSQCEKILLASALCRVLQFLFTEINYGGRVTDDKDRRLINTLITNFCGPPVLEEGFTFSPSGTYKIPGCETVAQVGSAVEDSFVKWMSVLLDDTCLEIGSIGKR